jgi:hypothetical protein
MTACLAAGLCACGGTTLDTASVFARSTDDVLRIEEVDDEGRTTTVVLDKTALPEQSPVNVKVFTAIPEFPYCIVDTFLTDFSYEKDSVTYKDIERKKHLKMLRGRAGQCGANGILVVYDDNERDYGGETNYDMLAVDGRGGRGGVSNVTSYRPGNVDVVHSSNMTMVRVKTYAIYYAKEP